MGRLARAILIGLSLSVAAGPAAADGLTDQYRDARTLLLVDPLDVQAAVYGYHDRLTEGLDGYWTEMGALGDTGPEVFSAACERFPTAVVSSEFQLILTRKPGTEDAVTTTYASVGSAHYTYATDVTQLLRALGMADPSTLSQSVLGARGSVAINASGGAVLLRPSADVFVVLPDRRPPQIYGRCPTP